ncbi:PIN domain-containing protein [Asticcacaulis sp.]|uniref:PIN domain-containing protein n=1 Tax=Asticcacaulis sp. TaxID=1872648 RepID=UPI003918DA0C
MPAFDEAVVRDRLVRNELRAISLDTSIFDRSNNAFHMKPLSLLDQFGAKGIQFILSKVVLDEVTGHVAENTAKAQEALQSALSKWKRILDLPELADVEKSLHLPQDAPVFAKETVEDFVNKTSAEIVSIDQDGLSEEVMRRYFAQEPPFADKGLKKQEFPDAFALLSLEDWAQTNDCFALLVSADKDWGTYCEGSKRLFCIENLVEAIALFTQQDDLMMRVSIDAYREGRAQQLQARVRAAILDYFEDFDPDNVGEYPFQYELAVFDATIDSMDLAADDPVSILSSDDTSISISARFRATVTVTAEFEVSVWDSVDKEYVNLGSDEQSRTATGDFETIIEIERGIHDEPSVNSVLIHRSDIRISFQNLEPNWRGDA